MPVTSPFMFPNLQAQPQQRLPTGAQTIAALRRLGFAMDEPAGTQGDSSTPAVYTYFGQLVDHDVSFHENDEEEQSIFQEPFSPLSVVRIQQKIKNKRSGALDLDSLYQAPAKRTGARLVIGAAAASPVGPHRPPGTTLDNDVPREPRNPTDPKHDRAALIGDPRNDEHAIINQLHVALLKAHNRLIDEGASFQAAQTSLRRHIQFVTLQDFLPRVCDPAIVTQVVQQADAQRALGIPLEFSQAAYRFGHSMVRADYDYNDSHPPALASLKSLVRATKYRGSLEGIFNTLPEFWIIEWKRFFAGEGHAPMTNFARRIDTTLAGMHSANVAHARALAALTDQRGNVFTDPHARSMAVRDLLRGYRLRLPTGQAVADALQIPRLSASQILGAAASSEQLSALQQGGLQHRTPLWYYILAEAKVLGDGGNRLGPVGSTIVARVLVGAVKRSQDSYLDAPAWTPSLGAVAGEPYQLKHLFKFAGVL